MQVNAETLQEKIKYLELCKVTPVLGISLNEEYQLEAYKMLLAYLLHDGTVDYLYGIEDKLND